MFTFYHPDREKYYYLEQTKNDVCVFCEVAPELIIAETEHMTLLANLYPYGSGHCLIVTKDHKLKFADLTDDELKEKDQLINTAIKGFKEVFDTDSYNWGYNEGPYSGGSLKHFHIHLIPRFDSRPNFVALLNGTVNAIAPKDTAARLKEALT